MNKIAVLDTGYDSYEYEHRLFAEQGFELIIYDKPAGDHHLKIEFAREAVGILVRNTVIDEDGLAIMPGLKAIVRYGVGYDNIDIKAAAQKGIRVANVQGYANHAVSDHAMALMFACTRGLSGDLKTPFGTPWRKKIIELHHKTLGIIGIGRIGSQFSRKVSPLFHRTLAYDPYKSADYMKVHGAEKSELSELLTKSDVITLHCNLTEETRHLLNDSAFRNMHMKPVIINTSRGPVIDENSLLEALNHGLIHSAGLDVYEKEPPGKGQHQLLSHPHVVSTSHLAWYSENSMKELQLRAAHNMIDLLSGKTVDDELKPS